VICGDTTRTFVADLLVASPQLSSSTRVKHRTAQRFAVSSRRWHWKPGENPFPWRILQLTILIGQVNIPSWGQLGCTRVPRPFLLLRRVWFQDYTPPWCCSLWCFALSDAMCCFSAALSFCSHCQHQQSRQAMGVDTRTYSHARAQVRALKGCSCLPYKA